MSDFEGTIEEIMAIVEQKIWEANPEDKKKLLQHFSVQLGRKQVWIFSLFHEKLRKMKEAGEIETIYDYVTEAILEKLEREGKLMSKGEKNAREPNTEGRGKTEREKED